MAEFDEYLFDRQQWIARVSAEIGPWMGQVMAEGAATTLAITRRLGLEARWDVTNPKVASWIEGYTYKFAEKITGTASDAMSEIIGDGLRNGLSNREIQQAILNDPIMGAVSDDYRAEMIARTETARANVNGELRAAIDENTELEAQGLPRLFTRKVWNTAADCCEFCAALDGKTIDIEEAYAKVGDTIELDEKRRYTLAYEDAQGPPLHPNCRCAVTLEVSEDYK